jgi:hypothetical protein
LFLLFQVIIVRTEESKHRLPEELKRSGLVCTVMESKGLEFDDVLLWNFFTDSEADGEWRAITKYCQVTLETNNQSTSLPTNQPTIIFNCCYTT